LSRRLLASRRTPHDHWGTSAAPTKPISTSIHNAPKNLPASGARMVSTEVNPVWGRQTTRVIAAAAAP
jgi:hypothetical protein